MQRLPAQKCGVCRPTRAPPGRVPQCIAGRSWVRSWILGLQPGRRQATALA